MTDPGPLHKEIEHRCFPLGYLEDNSTSPPTIVRLGDDYPASWTMPYTQNTDLGKAQAQYPVPGEPPKCECDKGKGVSKLRCVSLSNTLVIIVNRPRSKQR